MVRHELTQIADLVDAWSPDGCGDEVAEAWALIDRLTAKATAATGELDAAGAWEVDGATSLVAWLRVRARMTGARARQVAHLARRCRSWPTTAQAWEGGTLSYGQVQAIAANVGHRAAPRYAEHERDLVPTLAPLSTADTAVVMRTWSAHAEAERDDPVDHTPDGRSRLHCSTLLDGRRRVDGELSLEDGEIVGAALRRAERPPTEGEAPSTPAERRAEAFVGICRSFLDDPAPTSGPGQADIPRVRGRSRPHLNVICDLEAITDPRGLVRLLDGTPLDRATSRRLLCDATVHRVITRGPSITLDHGRGTRTVPDGLFHALVIRDRGCRFPGCDRPPEWTEAHHLVPWSHGGPTTLGNLVLLCARHHHLTHGQAGHRQGWQLHLEPDGAVTATSPEGAIQRSRPPP